MALMRMRELPMFSLTRKRNFAIRANIWNHCHIFIQGTYIICAPSYAKYFVPASKMESSFQIIIIISL